MRHKYRDLSKEYQSLENIKGKVISEIENLSLENKNYKRAYAMVNFLYTTANDCLRKLEKSVLSVNENPAHKQFIEMLERIKQVPEKIK